MSATIFSARYTVFPHTEHFSADDADVPYLGAAAAGAEAAGTEATGAEAAGGET